MLICISGFVVGTGEIVVTGDGNYAASSNGQCLLHIRSRHSTSLNASMASNIKKTPSRPAEDVVKRTRSLNVYELSQDLLDKQIELLERKYGGHARANHAARVIQRAFRHYSMRRKFATITAMAKADRRLSRRLHSDVDTAWANVGSADSTSASTAELSVDESSSQAEYVIRSNFAALYRELAESTDVVRTTRTAVVRQQQSSRMSPLHHSSSPLSSSSAAPPVPADAVAAASQYQFQYMYAHIQQQQMGLYPGVQQYANHIRQVNSHLVNGGCGPADGGGGGSPNASHHHHPHLHHHLSSGELRRCDSSSSTSSTSSKRVPPEVPRRTSSALSKSPHTGGSLSRSMDVYESPESRRSGRAAHPAPLLHPEGERRTNLSEHSASEDSLEGTGYSTTFWCDQSVVGTSHVHSSPLPFPPVHYDRLVLNRSSTPAEAALASSVAQTAAQAKLLESIRKRQYRVGLNLFNKKPERGIVYLTQKGFLENTPRAVAKFFITRKGVSKQMIGEYLGNLQNPFNMATLDFFIEELDFKSLDIDVALRKFQTHFRMPGEAQKIERLMEVFGHRYCQCNPQVVSRLQNPDTVFILAFAVIMLNTDLHTPSIKADKRMKLEDFIKNLRGIDDGSDIDRELLVGIYERVKSGEFKPGADHVTQVLKVQQSIVGKKPNLVLPHRRLVCYCRLYEVADAARRERPGLHQREVFLFNDILVVTKIFSKKKNGVTYSFRQSFQLAGLNVSYFESSNYSFGIRLCQRVDNRTLIMFNARNEHDRSKFCEDLREAILEMDEMESLRIEGELDKQRNNSRISRVPNGPAAAAATAAGSSASSPTSGSTTTVNGRDKADNRDSGVADMDHNGSVSTLEEPCTPRRSNGRSMTRESVLRPPEVALKRTTLSNSLLDIHDPAERYQRRGSVGSLDSGMSVSFQSSTTNSTVSRDSSPKNLQVQHISHHSHQGGGPKGRGLQHQSSFLGNIFLKRERKNSRGSECALPKSAMNSFPAAHCTDV